MFTITTHTFLLLIRGWQRCRHSATMNHFSLYLVSVWASLASCVELCISEPHRVTSYVVPHRSKQLAADWWCRVAKQRDSDPEGTQSPAARASLSQSIAITRRLGTSQPL